MDFVITPRAGGKTSTLITWLLEDESKDGRQQPRRVILVPTALQRLHLIDTLRSFGLTKDKAERSVFSMVQLNRLKTLRVVVGIDNAEQILQALVGSHDIALVAATGENVTPTHPDEGTSMPWIREVAEDQSGKPYHYTGPRGVATLAKDFQTAYDEARDREL